MLRLRKVLWQIHKNKNTAWKRGEKSPVEFQTWSCTMAARACELIHSQLLKGKQACATYGSVFPEPGPHGSVIMHINMTCSELGEAGSLLSLSQNIFFSFFKSSIWWWERDTAIRRACPHMEAITSNGTLELSTQLKWNHRNLDASCQISCY